MQPEGRPAFPALEARMLRRLHDATSGRTPLHLLGDRNDFETLVRLFPVVDLSKEGRGTVPLKDGSIYLNSLTDMVRRHAQHRTSHVLITGLNENWGAFSTHVPERTVDWGVWQEHLREVGCTPHMVRQYLDDPAVKAVVTPHHTAMWHPSILSLPVGISTRFMRWLAQNPRQLPSDAVKTEDLLISNSGWGHRQQVNQRVSANFEGRVTNRFALSLAEFSDSVLRSRFVLCPSGLGWDTSRLWETLTLGSIPIIEYSEGWHTALDHLPALFVTNFDEVTPALLARAYPEILADCERFDFGKLTQQWWVSRINGLLNGCG